MKSKLINGIITTAICAIIAILMHSCAQQVSSISGGPKDTIAPLITKSSPELFAAYYDGNMVKIKFDEYFTLDNIEQTFLMSPPHDSLKPKIKVKGKWLTLKFREPLRPDTTYTLQFFNSLKDFNEGNVLPGFQFAFSTGPVVDSLAVSGRVLNAETLEKEPDMLVMLYGERTAYADSAFLKHKPDYITRTDTAGYFFINNVRPGIYNIYALKDINESQRFDLENEKIAFLKTRIEPHAEHLQKIDSLYAGTILHRGEKGHRYLDTLKNDTVIVQDLIYTTPNNITLYAFEEKHLVQYISERNRDIRQRINLVFNKSVESDTVLITYVDDTLRSPEMIYDFNYFRDSLTVWLKDTADINNDTLQIRVTFATLDSLQMPTTETDTLNVKFAKKRPVASKDKKSKPQAEKKDIDSLNFTVKSNFSGEFDMEKSIKLTVPIMYDHIDTSLIKIYECVDSTFDDDMNQKILKNQRLDSAHYRLIFKRPILGDIVWYPTDSIVSPDWYRATYSAGRDTVELEVLDSAMIYKSKFANMLKYHNEYYMGQVQKIRDSVNTVIIDQKRVKYDRVSRDTILLVLEKSPTREISVTPINLDKLPDGGIEVQQNGDHISILLRDSSAIRKDTLVLKFTTFDRYIHNRAHKVTERTFKDTLYAIYKIKFQSLKEKKLVGKDTMRFVFGRRLSDMPKVQLCKYPEKGISWYTPNLNDGGDTLSIVSADQDFLMLDTIQYAISYPTLNKQEEPIWQTDTLQMVRPKEEPAAASSNRRKSDIGKETQQQQEAAKQNMAKASLRFPVEYTMNNDTMNAKNKILTFASEAGKQYMLEVDDSAFVSIYNTPNLYLDNKAKIRMPDYYGEMTINIQNLGYMEHYPDIDDDLPPFEEIDTSHTLRRRINPRDTMAAEYTQISEGQALVCLCGAKGEIKYMQSIKCDSTVSFQYILPGEYTVKIIHDRNMNGKWDTGKYLEQSYPERVLKFPKKQTVKSKWNTEAVWRL